MPNYWIFLYPTDLYHTKKLKIGSLCSFGTLKRISEETAQNTKKWKSLRISMSKWVNVPFVDLWNVTALLYHFAQILEILLHNFVFFFF